MLPPDEVLIVAYAKARLTADRVCTEAKSRQEFMAILPHEFQNSDSEAVAKRLLNLRKGGFLTKTKQF